MATVTHTAKGATMVTRVLTALLLIVVVGGAVDVTVLSPVTFQDEYGNTADKDSKISFVAIEDKQKYKSGGDKDAGSIEPFYDLAQSIIDTSLPGEYPIDLLQRIKDGEFDIGGEWQGVAVDYLGYVIAVVTGILFLIIFPIIGCCFCCCRCCGRCGGRRVIKSPEEGGMGKKFGRWASLIVLSIITLMALTGVALMYVTNNNLSDSLGDFQENVDKLDDVTDFFDSTIDQAHQAVDGNFNFTMKVLYRDLDNIGFLLGQPIKEKVLESTGLDDIYQDIENLETDSENLKTYLETLETEKAKIIQHSEKFDNFTRTINKTVSDIASTNNNFATNVPSRDFVTDFDGQQLPDETPKRIVLDGFLTQGVSSLIGDSRQTLNDIPEQVQNDTEQSRQDIKDEVDTYKKDVTKATDDIEKMRDDFLDGIDFEDMKTNAKDYAETAKEYDKYRWYGGLGLACIMMLIVLLIVLGIIFGTISGNSDVDPTKRSSLSHAGGNLLTSSVILIFIFGWLTMLMTTLLYTLGSPADKFVCQPFEDLSIIDEVIEKLDLVGSPSGNSSWLGDLVYSDKEVNLKLAEVLKACENGEGVYTALKMEEGNVVNLTELTDYSDSFDIDKELSKLNVGFDDINITTADLLQFINHLRNFDSTMDYAAYNTTLSVKPVTPTEQFLTELETYLTNFPGTADKTELEDIKTQTQNHINDEGRKLKDSIDTVLQTIENVKQITRQPPNNTLAMRCDTIKQGLDSIGNNMSTFAEQAFNESLEVYKNRIKGILDTFVADVEHAVKNELGICTPLWNLYSDLVQHAVCGSVLGSVSGWWCAMGWTLFFMVVSMFASVSLSKHFVRMRYSEEEEKYTRPSSSRSSSHHFQNKVFHSDAPEAAQKW